MRRIIVGGLKQDIVVAKDTQELISFMTEIMTDWAAENFEDPPR
ncbi:hypothetical protein N9L28_01235 [Luminiphilus sp.]|nr:hypothetical protein [Luminiphilus sp.]